MLRAPRACCLQRFEPAGLELIHEAFQAAGFVPRRTTRLPIRASMPGGSAMGRLHGAAAGALSHHVSHPASQALQAGPAPAGRNSGGGEEGSGGSGGGGAWAKSAGRPLMQPPVPPSVPLAAEAGHPLAQPLQQGVGAGGGSASSSSSRQQAGGGSAQLPRDEWSGLGCSSCSDGGMGSPTAHESVPTGLQGTGKPSQVPPTHAVLGAPLQLDTRQCTDADEAGSSGRGCSGSSSSNQELRQALLLMDVDKDGEWEGTGLAAERSPPLPAHAQQLQQQRRQRQQQQQGQNAEARQTAVRQQVLAGKHEGVQGGVTKPSRFR